MYVLYPERSVSIVNEMKDRAEKGEQIFCDIYMDAEKQADPAKAEKAEPKKAKNAAKKKSSDLEL